MFTFYEVGGKVRDELMGLESKDIDYVAVPDFDPYDDNKDTYTIKHIFECLSDYLKKEGYPIFLETPDCFTIRAKFPKGHLHEGTVADFVLARKEIGYIEGTRQPRVVPGILLDDLSRRDFTVNAIARAEDGTLIDPFDGQRDIQMKILKTPISGDITFADDPLRLLRAIRFAITKGFQISFGIRQIIHSFDYENKFLVVSEERIREELYKCFKFSTIATIAHLKQFEKLTEYIFTRTNLWLKPTNES
jgi:poly(A) polymerase